jgi:hypothetical protein
LAKRKLPDHIPGTNREWKQRKRREWRAVLKALDTFRMGCAFTPAYDRVKSFDPARADRIQWRPSPWGDVEEATKDITTRLAIKQWGR